MSRGLLQGLAERALGVAQPLRSQQAVRAASMTHDDPVHEAAPLLPMGEAAALHAAPFAARTAPGPAQSASPIQASLAGAETASPQARSAPAHAELAEALPPALLLPLVVETVMPAVSLREPLLPTHTQAPSHPAPVAAPASTPNPAPLLPPQAAAWPMPTTPPARAAAPERAAAGIGGMAAAAQATEVHVSIGRVELIAHAPAPTPRPVARPRESTRSLADYLRSGAKG